MNNSRWDVLRLLSSTSSCTAMESIQKGQKKSIFSDGKIQTVTVVSYIAKCISVDGTTPLMDTYREIDVTLVY